MPRITPFGKRVIGEEAAARQREIVKTSAHVFGHRVIGKPKTDPVGPDPLTVPEPAIEAMGTRKVAELLEASPFMVDRVLEAERARPDGVRVTVLREALKAEQAKPEPRNDLIASLEAEIESKTGETPQE